VVKSVRRSLFAIRHSLIAICFLPDLPTSRFAEKFGSAATSPSRFSLSLVPFQVSVQVFFFRHQLQAEASSKIQTLDKG